MVRKRLAEEMDAFRGSAWVATFCAAVSGTAFILAFKHTSVANVALIYATAPFLAAVIAWTWFAERPRPVVMVAGMVSLLGVAIIMRDLTYGGGIFGDGDDLCTGTRGSWNGFGSPRRRAARAVPGQKVAAQG